MAEANTHFALGFFDPFIDEDNVESRWQSWLSRFENYLIAMNITNIERKRALLLHYGGEHVFSIYETFANKETDKYNDLVKKLTDHFKKKNKQPVVVKPKLNLPNVEKQTGQLDDQKNLNKLKKDLNDLELLMDGYKPKVKRSKCNKCGRDSHAEQETCPALGKHCKICNQPNHFDRVCRNKNKEKTEDKTMLKMIEKLTDKIEAINVKQVEDKANNKRCHKCGRAAHSASETCPAFGKHCKICNQLNHFDKVCRNKKPNNGEQHQNENNKESKPRCLKCGRSPHKEGEVCPALGKTCTKCNKPNHLTNVCRVKTVKNQVNITNLHKVNIQNNSSTHYQQHNVFPNSQFVNPYENIERVCTPYWDRVLTLFK